MMFLGGDSSKRRRIDLGGRSMKQMDRKEFLQHTHLKRNERFLLRQHNSALKIQKHFRAYKVVRTEQSKLRQKFPEVDYINWNTFGPDSNFLRQFLYFFNEEYIDDFQVLANICQLLLQFVDNVDEESESVAVIPSKKERAVVRFFVGEDCSSEGALVNYRVKKLAYICIRALHHDGNQLKDELISNPKGSDGSVIPLLKVLILLIDFKMPWSCMIIEYLSQNKGFSLLREFILRKNHSENSIYSEKGSPLEHFLTTVFCHIDQKPCICSDIDLRYSFSSQILTIPCLWNVFPNFKKVFARQGMISSLSSFLPKNISDKFPTYARLLASPYRNDGVPSFPAEYRSDVPIDLAAVSTFPMEVNPSPTRFGSRENSMIVEDDMTADAKGKEVALDRKLDQQNCYFVETHLFLNKIHTLFIAISNAKGPYDMEVVAVDEVCGFLYSSNTIPLERFTSKLAYESELIPFLWDFMKRRHEKKQLSSLSDGATGCLLPLVVFCSLYNHMLKKVDNEEFYKQKKLLSLEDTRSLVILLKQALWQLLWENHTPSANSARFIQVTVTRIKLSIEALQHRVIIEVSELLSQLQDWNNRRQFTSPVDFYADGVNDDFISQAVNENTREYEILKQAPFLIPYPIRVKIFNSQVAAAKTSIENVFIIRRDHIFEDACNQMRQLSEDDLRGKIRVTYVNDHGIQEAGIDAGGLFKDFIDMTTRIFFGGEFELFKETEDYQLYPNPGSGNIYENHLQFFFFLGTLLAKAIFEGIPVDLSFASFFLKKFKNERNNLHDLASLDPIVYKTLISLKHVEDISKWGLFFCISDKETDKELLPGGKDKLVTNDNFLIYISLSVRYYLNLQMHEQCSHFLSGFQKLIQKRWTDMFNENELQILISGPDSLDVDDLQLHTKYTGYNSEDCVIKMFWEVLEGFSIENKKKLLIFVTSCSRGPSLGFGYLRPLFTIRRDRGNLERLPSAATCSNTLNLPPYKSKDQLQTKLEYAINYNAGFDLC